MYRLRSWGQGEFTGLAAVMTEAEKLAEDTEIEKAGTATVKTATDAGKKKLIKDAKATVKEAEAAIRSGSRR